MNLGHLEVDNQGFFFVVIVFFSMLHLVAFLSAYQHLHAFLNGMKYLCGHL